MTLDDTDTIEPRQADDAAAAAPDTPAVDGTPHEPAPRSHWDKVLAAVQERA